MAINRNRMGNVHNPYQKIDKHKRVLCVCSAGILRSPTTALILGNPPFNFNTRAVGYDKEFALIPVDDALIEWADEIVCMDGWQINFIKDNFNVHENQIFHDLDIDDDYDYRNKKLIKIITKKCKEIFKK